MHSAEDHNESEKLTDRETEILLLLCDGLSSKAIAAKLGICQKTVEFHRTKLKRHLKVDSVAMIVRWAVRNKLIEP